MASELYLMTRPGHLALRVSSEYPSRREQYPLEIRCIMGRSRSIGTQDGDARSIYFAFRFCFEIIL